MGIEMQPFMIDQIVQCSIIADIWKNLFELGDCIRGRGPDSK